MNNLIGAMIAPYIFVCAAARLIPLASWQGMAGRRVQQAQPACAVVIMANGEWIGAMALSHPVALGNPWPKVAFDHSVRRCYCTFFSPTAPRGRLQGLAYGVAYGVA